VIVPRTLGLEIHPVSALMEKPKQNIWRLGRTCEPPQYPPRLAPPGNPPLEGGCAGGPGCRSPPRSSSPQTRTEQGVASAVPAATLDQLFTQTPGNSHELTIMNNKGAGAGSLQRDGSACADVTPFGRYSKSPFCRAVERTDGLQVKHCFGQAATKMTRDRSFYKLSDPDANGSDAKPEQ
jgi:hypothetical protein